MYIKNTIILHYIKALSEVLPVIKTRGSNVERIQFDTFRKKYIHYIAWPGKTNKNKLLTINNMVMS